MLTILKMARWEFAGLGVVVVGAALGTLARSKHVKTAGHVIEMLGFLIVVLLMMHGFAITK